MSVSVKKPPPATACEELITELENLRQAMAEEAAAGAEVILGLPPERQRSAENLLHYLAVGKQDLESLQVRLASLGLSSLGRSEAHVMATLNSVLHNLYLLDGGVASADSVPDATSGSADEVDYLEQNTISLLGKPPEKRRARIEMARSKYFTSC